MAGNTPLDYETPSVIGVLDADIDPQGHIPPSLLSTGIQVVVPLWPEPAKEPGEYDTLTMCYDQDGQDSVRIINTYKPEDMKPEFLIRLGPEHLKNNGVGQLWYELANSAGNPSKSFERSLTIDHTSLRSLPPITKAIFTGFIGGLPRIQTVMCPFSKVS